MNFQQTSAVLADLPTTFLRSGPPYTQFQDSLASAITRGTSATDVINNQVASIQNARFGWLDIWGLLFGLPRLSNEADSHYLSRIQYEVLAGNGTPVGICAWILAVWGIQATLTENETEFFYPDILSDSDVLSIADILAGTFSQAGYTLQFASRLTLQQLNLIVNSLARVRPAGVPFSVQTQSAGPYLTTVNFLNAPRTTGAFIGSAVDNANITLSPSTNNSQPLLPALFMSDLEINSVS